MKKITFCIPSKSNLRYLKTCIPSIRKNAYREDHDIIIFVDSDEDGTVDWLEENKDQYDITYYVNPTLNEKLYGIGEAYDYCIRKAETDIVMIFHADMILGVDADLNAFKHLTESNVVCSTRIEPPLHPNAGEKILEDFGVWPEDFDGQKFNDYVKACIQKYANQTTDGIFAPWMLYKNVVLGIGGHDPKLKSAREDSDLFNRLVLNGVETVQSWDSLVYHYTGRGGQFQHGKFEDKSQEWQQLMNNSTFDFIRKWGSEVKHTPMMKPIIPHKYDIGFDIKLDCEKQIALALIKALEPWCSNVSVDATIRNIYITQENKNTEFDLNERILENKNLTNDVVVSFTANGFLSDQQSSFSIIQQLPAILDDSGEIGKFEIGSFTVDIRELKTYERNLIRNEN